jgi:hypothetical protein
MVLLLLLLAYVIAGLVVADRIGVNIHDNVTFDGLFKLLTWPYQLYLNR